MITCKVCDTPKEDEEFPFYLVRGVRGRRKTCKLCWNKKWSPVIAKHFRRYYDENPEWRETMKSRAAATYEANPDAQYARNKEYQKKFPERHAARIAVTIALHGGHLIRKPCEICGDEKTDAHHDDYSKPLDVRWLCRIHHAEWHRKKRREAEFPT